MGSLMPGWDSPVLESKPGLFERNQSLTKEDIEAFWRSNKETNTEHLNCAIQEMNGVDELGRKFQKSSSVSVPMTRTKEDMEEETTEASVADKFMKKHGWWVVSNWAFLNEPPTLTDDATSNTSYALQFHVSSDWASKSNAHDQIST